MAIPVFLDSSCFWIEISLDDGAFDRLAELIRDNIVEAFTCDLVVKEISTGFLESLHGTTKKRKDIGRSLSWLPSDASREKAKMALANIAELESEAERSIEEGVRTHLARRGIKILEVGLEHMQNAWRGYFGRLPPFKSLKNRNDIPDAFIFSVAQALAKQYQAPTALSVVVRDALLAQAYTKSGCAVHSKLGDFFTSEVVKQAIRRHNEGGQRDVDAAQREAATKARKETIREILKNDFDTIKSDISAALERRLEGQSVVSRKFPSDDGTGTIYGVGGVYDLDLDRNGIEDLGPGSALVPFAAKVEQVLIVLYADKGEFYSHYGDDHAPGISVTDDDWNEHVLQAEAEVELSVNGTLRIECEVDEYETYRLSAVDIEQLDRPVVDEDDEARE